jgi:hypothetical protein
VIAGETTRARVVIVAHRPAKTVSAVGEGVAILLFDALLARTRRTDAAADLLELREVGVITRLIETGTRARIADNARVGTVLRIEQADERVGRCSVGGLPGPVPATHQGYGDDE